MIWTLLSGLVLGCLVFVAPGLLLSRIVTDRGGHPFGPWLGIGITLATVPFVSFGLAMVMGTVITERFLFLFGLVLNGALIVTRQLANRK